MSDKVNVLKSKTKKVYKSNNLNKFGFANFNLNDYRVYLNAISLIGGVDMNGKYLQPEELKREHILHAVDFAKQFNLQPNHAYEILKNAVSKLMKTDIKVEKPDLFTTTVINVCSKVDYNHKEGSITVKFTDDILDHLKQQIGKKSQFTLYNLNEIVDLTSIYAVRLYELMQQFKNGFVIYNLKQWREVFGISSSQYKLYGHLKNKVFNQALLEINSKTGYKVTMTEEKDGRKVLRVRFDYASVVIHSEYDIHGVKRSRHVKPRKATPIPRIDNETEQQELEI
jgi:plasmid replication initiation protein